MTAPTSAPDRPTVDRTRSTPLYIQLTAALREKIEREEWKSGQRIPSENELNRMYGISRMTVRQVLGQLIDERLLFRVPGKGTYVAQSAIGVRAPAYGGIRAQLEHPQATTNLLSREVIAADPTVAERLQISPNDPVHRVARIRLVGGEPVSLHTSFVPARLAADLGATDLVNRQLCVILDHEYGLRMGRVTESLESIRPSAAEAKLLCTRKTASVLLLRQEVATPDGLLFEYSRILFRGDKIKLNFQYDLHLTGGEGTRPETVDPVEPDLHSPASYENTMAPGPSRPTGNEEAEGRGRISHSDKVERGGQTGPLVRSTNRAESTTRPDQRHLGVAAAGRLPRYVQLRLLSSLG